MQTWTDAHWIETRIGTGVSHPVKNLESVVALSELNHTSLITTISTMQDGS